MMNKILEQTTRSFWHQLVKAAASHSAALVLAEAVRAKLYVWKEVQLKQELREMELQHRQEDLDWEEYVEQRRAARGATVAAPTPDEQEAQA